MAYFLGLSETCLVPRRWPAGIAPVFWLSAPPPQRACWVGVGVRCNWWRRGLPLVSRPCQVAFFGPWPASPPRTPVRPGASAGRHPGGRWPGHWLPPVPPGRGRSPGAVPAACGPGSGPPGQGRASAFSPQRCGGLSGSLKINSLPLVFEHALSVGPFQEFYPETGIAGPATPGSSCRTRQWYFTVLSQPTLRVCLMLTVSVREGPSGTSR